MAEKPSGHALRCQMTIRLGWSSSLPAKVTNRMSFRRLAKSSVSKGSLLILCCRIKQAHPAICASNAYAIVPVGSRIAANKPQMPFIDRIQKDLTAAMKSKDELRLSVLRMVKTALKNKEIEKIRPLDDAESLQVLQTLVKQRKESVEQFSAGGRKDLADKETREIAIIETYLPAAANEFEMDRAIEAAITETSANSPKQMGAVIKAARAR